MIIGLQAQFRSALESACRIRVGLVKYEHHPYSGRVAQELTRGKTLLTGAIAAGTARSPGCAGSIKMRPDPPGLILILFTYLPSILQENPDGFLCAFIKVHNFHRTRVTVRE